MNKALREAFNNEMRQAKSHYANADYTLSFYHLERAHILGQSYNIPHSLSHFWMLKIGLQRHSYREITGQILRLLAALLFSRLWVPAGNTGGTNISAFKSKPIPKDLADFLER